jgi:hypothetical protein
MLMNKPEPREKTVATSISDGMNLKIPFEGVFCSFEDLSQNSVEG